MATINLTCTKTPDVRSVTIKISGAKTTDTCKIWFYKADSAGNSTGTAIKNGETFTPPTITISGLTPDTSYIFTITVTRGEDSGSIQKELISTNPEPINLTCTKTPDVRSVTINISGALTTDTCKIWFYKADSAGNSTGTAIKNGETFTPPTITISGLDPDTSYVFTISVTRGNRSGSIEKELISTKPKPKPNKWSWGANIAENKPVSGLTDDLWNSFTSHINDVRKYKDKTKKSFTTVSSGDTITAAIVNEAINAINDMGKSLSQAVKNQTKITASFFTGMSDAIDSYI